MSSPKLDSTDISAASASTPMLKQYLAIKANHQDCILFFRLGDFYEMFFEDAKVASKILDLVLTSRGKGQGSKVPMCGIPHHASKNYIARLIKAGQKVAICDQVEDVSAAKGIVKRDVTRIITSGTYLDEDSNDARIILALSPNGKSIGLSFTDPTDGTIQTNQFSLNSNRIIDLLSKLPVTEVIYPEGARSKLIKVIDNPVIIQKQIVLSPWEDWCFNPEIAKKALCDHFAVTNLHGFGIEDLFSATSSTGALLEYLKQMNKQPLKHIDKISLYTDEDYLYISPAAVRGLELNNLIHTLDQTVTSLGRRRFQQWFYYPLKSKEKINLRQKAIQALTKETSIITDLKDILNKIPDLEKNLSRISCGYTHPRDLLAIRNTLELIPAMINLLKPLSNTNVYFNIEDIKDLREYLLNMINEDIPLAKPDGKVIKPGFNTQLDELKGIQENGRSWLKDLQTKEIKRTGINSLKIGFNKVFGYYIEITKAHAANVPQEYIRKQTLVNAERYITPELKEYEEKILTAQDKIIKIEAEIILDIRKKILDHSKELHRLCNSIASIDCIFSLSMLALSNEYCCPTIDDSSHLKIDQGRHPVVEKSLTDTFIANDTHLDCEGNHLVILTGPNMAGKSTYIRQTAVLTIMAQVGSYIPAKSATVGLVDKVFTRIGAHDDIAKGQSTFMVEMNEAADILNNMTERSLVILDEIGRGTSTFDGLSLAWALAEHLKESKARTLFATHFHELTALAEEHSGVKNYNVAVKEWKDEIVFLHKIIPGSADDSYGVYVAKLAGIPENVIDRAKQILTQLELKNDIKENLKANFSNEEQLSLFIKEKDPVAESITKIIKEIDIDNTTPLEAINYLKELKNKLNQ